MANKRCPICQEKIISGKENMIHHLEKYHEEDIPKGQPAGEFLYLYEHNGQARKCMICKKPTTWNKASNKYNTFCSEKCKNEYVKLARARNKRVYGKENLLNDPEQQKKMLANRSISGKYRHTDGGILTYTGTYEEDFCRMMDTFLGFPSEDIIMPSPHVYEYKYKGEKKFYFPDAFIPSLNLEIEIKDGGNNPNMHHKIQDVDKVKEHSKDMVMLKQKDFHYIKIENKEYDDFFKLVQLLANDNMTEMERIKKIKIIPEISTVTTYEQVGILTEAFSSVELNDSSIKKYKPSYKGLSHIRAGDDYHGKIIINNDEVVGFINVRKSDGMIQGLEVNPKYRNNGVATSLLNTAVSQLGAHQLTVNRKNDIAHKLYLKNGWKDKSVSGQMILMVKESATPLTHDEMSMMMEVKFNDKEKPYLDKYVMEHGCLPDFIKNMVPVTESINNSLEKELVKAKKKLFPHLTVKEKEQFGGGDSKIEELDTTVWGKVFYANNEPIAYAILQNSGRMKNGIEGDLVFSLITHPDYRGKGYGTELLKEALKFYVSSKYTSLSYITHKDNIGSVKLAEKYKLTRLPQDCLLDDIKDDWYVFVLDKRGFITAYDKKVDVAETPPDYLLREAFSTVSEGTAIDLKAVKYMKDTIDELNPIIEIDGKMYRPRVETIVFNSEGKVLVDNSKPDANYGVSYSLPGGGFSHEREPIDQAYKECQEEALINITNVNFTGITYITEYNGKYPEWQKKQYWPAGIRYEGGITLVYTADYKSDFEGRVKETDKDSFCKRAKWIDINDIKWRKEHLQAIDIYRNSK